MRQCFPQDKRKGGGEGEFSGCTECELYLGAWWMCILSRCTETDSEQFLLDLCYVIIYYMPFVHVINVWLSERGKRPPPPFTFKGNTGTHDVQLLIHCLGSHSTCTCANCAGMLWSLTST